MNIVKIEFIKSITDENSSPENMYRHYCSLREYYGNRYFDFSNFLFDIFFPCFMSYHYLSDFNVDYVHKFNQRCSFIATQFIENECDKSFYLNVLKDAYDKYKLHSILPEDSLNDLVSVLDGIKSQEDLHACDVKDFSQKFEYLIVSSGRLSFEKCVKSILSNRYVNPYLIIEHLFSKSLLNSKVTLYNTPVSIKEILEHEISLFSKEKLSHLSK
jgi:hypothetical protein